MDEPGGTDAVSDLMAELASDPECGNLGPVIVFAIQQYTNLRMLDEALGGLTLHNHRRPAAIAMRKLYERWCTDADALLARAKRLGFHECRSAEFMALSLVVGRTQ